MIRIGIVGCGRILAAHLRGYQIVRAAGGDDFRITALCARRATDAWSYLQRGKGPPQRGPASSIPGDPLAVGDIYLSDFQSDVEVAVYDDYREMISDGAIDAVNDFSTHRLHHAIAALAFEHQKDVLTQKPLAATVAAGRRMCQEAESRGRVLGVFENARFNPATRHLAWLVESGRIGRVQMILMGSVGAWWAPDRIVAHTPWRHRRQEAGGITLDLGVHYFHQMRLLAGEPRWIGGRAAIIEPERFTRDEEGRPIQQVDCDADDTFFSAVEFESGAVAHLAASWAGHGEATRMGAGSVVYGSAGRASGGELTRDDGTRHSLAELYDHHAEPARRERDFPGGITDGFALTQYDWLRAVRQREEPQASGRQGLRDLAAAYAVLESHQAGRRVAFEEVLSGRIREYQRPLDDELGLS